MTPTFFTKVSTGILTAAVLVVVLAAGAWWYFKAPHGSSAPTTAHLIVLNDILGSSSDFTLAQKQMYAGDHSAALASYQKALQETSDPVQQLQINIFIALETERTGNYLAAIPLYKAIAADRIDGTRRGRAYAVEQMADMYYIYGDPQITAEIFKDDPYASMVAAGDTKLTYRHLYGYAISFYPIGNAELRVADWYAQALLASQTAAAGSPAALSASDAALYVSKIHSFFQAADADIAHMRQDGTVNDELRETLLEKAVVLGRMNRYGDTTLGSAEDIFKETQAAYASLGPPNDDSLRYQYAVFLARMYGAPRASDIHALLAPLYSDAAYAKSSTRTVLAHDRTVAGNAGKNNDLALAAVDPQFKTFLISLGWTAADFPAAQ